MGWRSRMLGSSESSTFLLEGQSNQPIENPSRADIVEALQAIHPISNSYFSLSDAGDSYVQAAGARSRLTVEYRCVASGDFSHFVLGHAEGDFEKDVYINCRCGPVRVKKNEVLTIAEAIEIFVRFFEFHDTPSQFVLREVTAMFKEEAG